MKKILLVFMLGFFQIVHAGTVYRDRYIPSNVCMVDLNGRSINAALILDIYSGTLQSSEYIGFKFNISDSYKITNYIGWQVTMINKEIYVFKEENLTKANQKKDDFLKQIKDSCK